MTKHLAGALALALIVAPSASAKQRCTVTHGRVIAASAQVVVLRPKPAPDSRGTYACLRSTGRKRWLGDGRGLERFAGRFVLHGATVVYEYRDYDSASEQNLEADEVRVLDVRSGRLRLHADAFSYSPVDEAPGLVGVRALRVAANGAVAWIATTSPADGVLSSEVWAADGAGARMLAAGGDIDANSLAVAADRVYWSGRDGAHVAPLTGAA